jgi:hypothetical protein
MRAIDPSGRQQLLGANDAERFAELVTDQILATVTARQRQIRSLDATPSSKPRNQLSVFVIRVRRDPEHAHPLRRVLRDDPCRN